MASRGVLVAFGVVVMVFATLSPHFLTVPTWASILAAAADSGIVVLGVALLMIAGEFDLSVGANFALCGWVFATLSLQHTNSVLALVATLMVGATTGFLNAVLTLFLKIPSFIATLGTMLILRGLVLLASGGYPVIMAEDNAVMQTLAGDLPAGLPGAFIWWFALGAWCHFLLNHTKTGNHILAAGSDADTAFLAGVPVTRVKLTCFILCGLLASLAGVVQFSHIHSAAPMAGDQYELYAITAAVIGGTSLRGGVGSIPGVILGTLLIGAVDAGLVQIGVSAYWYRAFIGLILIFAVIINLNFQASRPWKTRQPASPRY